MNIQEPKTQAEEFCTIAIEKRFINEAQAELAYNQFIEQDHIGRQKTVGRFLMDSGDITKEQCDTIRRSRRIMNTKFAPQPNDPRPTNGFSVAGIILATIAVGFFIGAIVIEIIINNTESDPASVTYKDPYAITATKPTTTFSQPTVWAGKRINTSTQDAMHNSVIELHGELSENKKQKFERAMLTIFVEATANFQLASQSLRELTDIEQLQSVRYMDGFSYQDVINRASAIENR